MNLKAVERNYLVRMIMDNKEKYKLTDDIEIEIQRGYEFNRRLDACSFAIIIDGEGLPTGAEALVHHNAGTPSFQVPNLKNEGQDVYSIPTDFLFCYREEGKDWMPAKDFLITKRIFKKYEGALFGIEPEQVSQRLYIEKGVYPNYEVEGKVCVVTKHSDYEIIFHDNGKEKSLVRTRTRELIAIDKNLTDEVKNGNLLIGNNLKDVKPYTKL